jgi:transcriptional regulator with XRE-family HTH domain
VAEALAIDVAASLGAEDFRVYHLSELLRRVRARTPVPPELCTAGTHEVGLSQEQAAALLVIGDRQYGNFERGAVAHPDPRFLDLVARVLGMTAAERDALYRLAVRHPPAGRSRGEIDAGGLRPVLESLEVPALVTDIAWNYVAWNRLFAEYVVDPNELPEQSRNAMVLGFGPVGAALFPAEPALRRVVVGRARWAYLADGGRSPVLRELVERLLAIPEAAAYWQDGPLELQPAYQSRVLVHPRQGSVKVKAVRTVLPGGLRISQFIPEHRPEMPR